MAWEVTTKKWGSWGPDEASTVVLPPSVTLDIVEVGTDAAFGATRSATHPADPHSSENNPFRITVTFSKAITGLALADFTGRFVEKGNYGNATSDPDPTFSNLQTVTAGTAFTVDVTFGTPSADAVAELQLPAGVTTSPDGENTASNFLFVEQATAAFTTGFSFGFRS